MERQKKIIDASVVVKWFAQEELSEKAVLLKHKYVAGEISLIAPELLFLELTNALRYKKFDENKLKESNNELFNLELDIVPLDNNLLNKSIEISSKHNLSIYDSVYCALAEINGAELITADDKLSKTPNGVALASL